MCPITNKQLIGRQDRKDPKSNSYLDTRNTQAHPRLMQIKKIGCRNRLEVKMNEAEKQAFIEQF
jgi:hypothetical protein